MRDDWYTDAVSTASLEHGRTTAESAARAVESMRAAGVGEDQLSDFDLPAMERAGVPLDGTVENRYAKPGRRILDRFDARDGSRVAPSELDIQLEGLKGAGLAVVAPIYDFGRGVVNLAGDIAEAGGEDPDKIIRPAPAGEALGFVAPDDTLSGIASGVITYGLGFGAAYARLAGLAAAPKTAIGRIAGTGTRGAAAGALMDVTTDPREDSLYHVFRESLGLESEFARSLDPALLYEESPLTARAAMAAEGAVIGAVGGAAITGAARTARAAGGAIASQWRRADELEQLAVGALSRSRTQLNSGLDPADVGWLTVWFGSKIMKGVQSLTADMQTKLGDLGALPEQITEAWNKAATIHDAAAQEHAARLAARPQFVQDLEDQAAHFVVPEVAGEQLPPELAAKTAVNYFTGPSPTGTTKRAIGKDVQEQSRALMPELMEETPENHEAFARLIATDAKTAIGRRGDESGGEWYRAHVEQAHHLAGLKHPEILSDPTAKSNFNFALAVTSNGLKVDKNGQLAIQAYEHFKATGRFPEDIGIGTAMNEINDGFRTFNQGLDTLGADQLVAGFDAEFTVREMRAAGLTVAGLQDETVRGSALVGPKIGGAFYQNLQGNLQPLTMDRWWRRTWGRYQGQVNAPEEKLVPYLDRFAKALTPAGAKYWGIPSVRAWKKLSRDEQIDHVLSVWKQFSQSDAGRKTPRNPRKPRPKPFVEGDDPLAQIARSVEKLVQPIEKMNDTQRAYMRSTVNRAVELLRADGIETQPADVQALLWFLEKDISAHRGQKAIDRSAFDDTMAVWAKKEGYSDGEVKGAYDAARAALDRRAAGGDVPGAEDRAAATADVRENFLQLAPAGAAP